MFNVMRSALRANPDMRLDWSGAEEQQPGGAADDNGPAGASGGAADAGEHSPGETMVPIVLPVSFQRLGN